MFFILCKRLWGSSDGTRWWQQACFQCCMKSICQQTIILTACDVHSLAELEGFYFSSEGGARVPCCLHSALRGCQPEFELLHSFSWHRGSFPHVHRLMTSLIQKQTTATSSWYSSQNTQPGRVRSTPAKSAPDVPKAFFLFNHPSFLSGIPHSKRTGICQDLWDLVCFWELDEILKTCYIVRVWNETCVIALTHACMHPYLSMQSCSNWHISLTLFKAIKNIHILTQKAPGWGCIKHLLYPYIAAFTHAWMHKHLSMQSCSNWYMSNIQVNIDTLTQKAPEGGSIKQLMPPCIAVLKHEGMHKHLQSLWNYHVKYTSQWNANIRIHITQKASRMGCI